MCRIVERAPDGSDSSTHCRASISCAEKCAPCWDYPSICMPVFGLGPRSAAPVLPVQSQTYWPGWSRGCRASNGGDYWRPVKSVTRCISRGARRQRLSPPPRFLSPVTLALYGRPLRHRGRAHGRCVLCVSRALRDECLPQATRLIGSLCEARFALRKVSSVSH